MMRRWIPTACLAGALLATTQVCGETLGDAIALAYQTNPALLANRADLRALDERYVQALAAAGPTASASGRYEATDASVRQSQLFAPGLASTRYRADTLSGQVSITLPLYAGGTLSRAIIAARADILAGRQSLRQQGAVLLVQVITAYADVLLHQALVSIADQEVETLRLQVNESEARFALRENTLTDRSQARARLIAARIKLDSTRGALTDSRSSYLRVVGVAPGSLEPPPVLLEFPPDIDSALSVAQNSNPQLLGSVYTEMASRTRVAAAKAADGFQVNLVASLAQQPLADYLGGQYERSMVAGIVVTKPLFTSGVHASRVREATETDNRDALRLADTRRQVRFLIVQTWNDLGHRRDELSSLREQLAQESEAFKGAKLEERNGLRSTIDVLNAEQEYQVTKEALAKAFHDEYLIRVNLLAAMGLLEAELLNPQIEAYRPEESFRRQVSRHALGWEHLAAFFDGVGAPRIAAEAPAVDPLGAPRPAALEKLPPAPRWADLTDVLAEKASSR